MNILCILFTVFIVVLALRAVLSWFPIRPGTPMAQINGLLFDLTEWALRPLRRVIPPAGMLDLSFLVLFIIVIVLQRAVCG